MSEFEVNGIDHIYLAVRDIGRSEAFYDGVMRLLGFRKSSGPLAVGPRHVHYYNRITQITLRPAERPGNHEPLAPGLHHICLRVPEPQHVDQVAEDLRELGVEVTEPTAYPEYDRDYYATFFCDPDGIRFEVVNHHHERHEIVRNWQDS